MFSYKSLQSPNSAIKRNKASTFLSNKAGRSYKLGSPKTKVSKNTSQALKTASMLSFFNDMSKKVRRILKENYIKNIFFRNIF